MDKSSPKKKIWIYIIGLLAWGIWISGVFGNNGILQAYQLSKVRRDLSLRVVALENERLRLTESLSAIESDRFTQEKAIRETLGYARPSELIFEVR